VSNTRAGTDDVEGDRRGAAAVGRMMDDAVEVDDEEAEDKEDGVCGAAAGERMDDAMEAEEEEMDEDEDEAEGVRGEVVDGMGLDTETAAAADRFSVVDAEDAIAAEQDEVTVGVNAGAISEEEEEEDEEEEEEEIAGEEGMLVPELMHAGVTSRHVHG
jgi:hypothetical protein